MWKLLHKNEIYGQNQASEGGKVVPLQRLATEEECGEEGEDNQCYNLLHNLQLHEGEWAAVTLETDAVGRYLAGILRKGDSPREDDDSIQGPRRDDLHLLELEVAIPRQRHKEIGDNEQSNGG